MAEGAPSTFLRNVLRQLGRNCSGLIQRKCHRKAEDADYGPQRPEGRGPSPSTDKELAGDSSGQGLPLWPNVVEEEDPASPLPTNATLHPTFLSGLPAGAVCLPGAATEILQLEFPLWVSVGGPRGLRRPSLLPTCHTSSSHFLPELPKTPHTMDLGTPRPRLTTMKGTQPKRVRGSPEVTQPD